MATKTKAKAPKTVEPSKEDLMRHIGSLEYELAEAKNLVGDLVIRNNRQERVIVEMEQKLNGSET